MTVEGASIGQQLSNPEKQVLNALRGKEASDMSALAAATGLGETETMSACSWLKAKGLVEIDEQATPLVGLEPEGRTYADRGLPERRLHNHLRVRDGKAPLSQLRNAAQFTQEELQIALAWWKRKGFGELHKQAAETIVVAGSPPAVTVDERVLEKLKDGSLHEEASVDPEGLKMLRTRRGVLKSAERKQRSVRLTPVGREVVSSPLSVVEDISQLTPELIQSGAWRSKNIRPYDVATPAPRTSGGKPHPLVQLIEEIRQIFVELGFQEIDEQFVVPVLWNMDALFIPQDHLARDMQDTFYLDQPATLPVEEDVIEKVRDVHLSGGGTGSRGWGGTFDANESKKALLRTHTTVGTIRHLAQHPGENLRVFSVGRVFRKETMDATHLPEFHQIEGIATEEGADFPMLLGILKEFYKRMGFEKLRWRPSYYPYTEPSMDVEVWTGKKWMELGGCGVFRPEVTQPFGIKTPVLAWGLGLERLAMLRFGLTDIRQIYISDLEWLRRQPLL
jgi:phenylalanyl-tRNA synthetase alpha chain